VRRYFKLNDEMGTRDRWLLDSPVDEQGKKINPEQFEAPERVGEYRVVERMRIDPGKVGGARVFRARGWLVLVVSEDLKRVMEERGISGTRFVEV